MDEIALNYIINFYEDSNLYKYKIQYEDDRFNFYAIINPSFINRSSYLSNF